MVVGGVAPVAAPVVGSALAPSFGWRGLLWIVAGIGAIALVATIATVPETRPRAAIKRAAAESHQGSGLRSLGTRGYVGNALAYGFAFAVMMAYISASPFLYQTMMGLSALQYGLMFGLNALVLTGVSALSARLTVRFSVEGLTRTGLLVNLGAVVVFAALTFTGAPPMLLAIPILFAVAAEGLIFGNTTALALGAVNPNATGLASAFLGLLQFILAGLVAPLVGIAGQNTAVPLAIVMLAASFIANAAAHIGYRRAPGDPHQAGTRLPDAEDLALEAPAGGPVDTLAAEEMAAAATEEASAQSR
jgi:DHA1 family bicyclomycin/chloramphenicol resistance-like MFS transporter